jgi:HEAT repeat protein
VLPEGATDSFLEKLKDENQGVQKRAAVVLGRQKNLPKEVIDHFVLLLEDGKEDLHISPAQTLSSQTKLHSEAVNNIVALLKDGKEDTQKSAARALGGQTNLPEETVNDIAALLEGEDLRVQRLAARALCGQTNLPRKAIEALMRANDSKVQGLAALVLGRQKTPPDRTIDNFLLTLLKDDNRDVQQSAVNALRERINLCPMTIDNIVALLKNGNWAVQKAAARALGGQTNLPEETVDDMVALLESGSRLRYCAAWALDKQTNLPINAIKALLKAKNPNLCGLRDVAPSIFPLMLLGTQENLPDWAIHDLVALLKDTGDQKMQESAAQTLGMRTTKFPLEVIDNLVELLNDKDTSRQDLAVKALGGQTNLRNDAIDSLVRLVKVEKRGNPPAAAWTLGTQECLSRKGVEALMRLFENGRAIGGQPIKNQPMVHLYGLLPKLEDSLKISLYRECLVPRSFDERAPLFLEGNKLCFYTSSGLQTVPLDDERAFRDTISKAQKKRGIPSRSQIRRARSSS